MNVRMLGGAYAGEVRNLPFLAARGAISSGLAVAIVAGVTAGSGREPLAVIAEPEQDVAQRSRGKKHGRPR